MIPLSYIVYACMPVFMNFNDLYLPKITCMGAFSE
jgi:hypothetical protein